jgi:hypothetical protein
MSEHFVLQKKRDINPDDYKKHVVEIIDKTHEAITVNKTINTELFIKFHNDREIYFSIRACKLLGLTPELTVHFINDGDEWLFYVDDDPDGFKLTSQPKKNTLSIFNQALTTLFLKRTRCSLPCKFPLKVTNSRFKGKPIIRIEINKPIS